MMSIELAYKPHQRNGVKVDNESTKNNDNNDKICRNIFQRFFSIKTNQSTKL